MKNDPRFENMKRYFPEKKIVTAFEANNKNDLKNIYQEMVISYNEKDYAKFVDIDTKFHQAFFKYTNNSGIFLVCTRVKTILRLN